MAVDVSDAKARGRNTKPWGRTPWFYRSDGREKGNRPPRSLGLPRAPPRHVMGHAPAIPIRSHQNRAERFTSPGDQTLLQTEGTWARKISFSGPSKPRETGVGPTISTDVSNKGWARERQGLRYASTNGTSTSKNQNPSQAKPGRHPREQDPRVSSKAIQLRKAESHCRTHGGSENSAPSSKPEHPLASWDTCRAIPPEPPGGLGGYTHRVRSRAPSGKLEHPLASRDTPG